MDRRTDRGAPSMRRASAGGGSPRAGCGCPFAVFISVDNRVGPLGELRAFVKQGKLKMCS
jgi:hypothetical protein